jgi:polyisoprenoid-binding protein YceI
MKRLIFALPLLIASVAHADSVEWTLDSSHTHVAFSVSHMLVSKVDGRFKQATAIVKLDDADLTKSQVSVDINAGSIDTLDEKRDEHLKSPEFFDTKKFPKLTFKSTKIARAGKNAYKLTGDLTIRDVTKSVTLDATLSAPVKTPWGKQMRAAMVTGKVNRTEFGLKWNKTLETGGLVVGEDVTLNVTAEVTK